MYGEHEATFIEVTCRDEQDWLDRVGAELGGLVLAPIERAYLDDRTVLVYRIVCKSFEHARKAVSGIGEGFHERAIDQSRFEISCVQPDGTWREVTLDAPAELLPADEFFN